MISVGAVVLSMGTRTEQLHGLLAALAGQREVDVDVVVVGNGWKPTGLPPGVRAVHLADNVGVPEARNIGSHNVGGDVLAFLDDDLVLDDTELLAKVAALFAADPMLGVVQPRAVDPVSGATARRHVPRLDVRDPTRSGDVAWFWEGCSFIRRSVFAEVGEWPGRFFYGHEGIEVAWRAIDRGYRIRYAADLRVGNPAAAPFRSAQHRFADARNRIWVARRNLPHPLLELYCAVWIAATLLRVRSRDSLLAAMRGFGAGMSRPAGDRRRIRWRTAWTLTQLGRPPIV